MQDLMLFTATGLHFTQWRMQDFTKAVFKRLLTSSKNRNKINKERHAAAAYNAFDRLLDDYERRKLMWKEELSVMSDFLVLKSTEVQKEEGAAELVDTAYIVDCDGLPCLRAVFDVQHFRPEDVQITADDDQLTIEAERFEDTDCSIIRRALVRKLDLPINVDRRRMFCYYSTSGLLAIEMPFHFHPRRRYPYIPPPLPPPPDAETVTPATNTEYYTRCTTEPATSHRKEQSTTIVPIIVDDTTGRRSIRLAVNVGPDFTSDDLTVAVEDGQLTVHAAYSAEIGVYGSEVTRREVTRRYLLPASGRGTDVESWRYKMSADGCVFIELLLHKASEFHCRITTEDVDLERSRRGDGRETDVDPEELEANGAEDVGNGAT